MPVTLFTARYQAFRPDMGVPVRTSNGHPRFKLSYKIEHKVKELMPPWDLVRAKMPHDEFAIRYRDLLDQHGVPKLHGLFRAIAEQAGDGRLTLLCFEDLAAGKTCHRRVFAAWWLERTGEDVREHGPTSAQGALR